MKAATPRPALPIDMIAEMDGFTDYISTLIESAQVQLEEIRELVERTSGCFTHDVICRRVTASERLLALAGRECRAATAYAAQSMEQLMPAD